MKVTIGHFQFWVGAGTRGMIPSAIFILGQLAYLLSGVSLSSSKLSWRG
jgi:hypothetical protein